MTYYFLRETTTKICIRCEVTDGLGFVSNSMKNFFFIVEVHLNFSNIPVQQLRVGSCRRHSLWSTDKEDKKGKTIYSRQKVNRGRNEQLAGKQALISLLLYGGIELSSLRTAINPRKKRKIEHWYFTSTLFGSIFDHVSAFHFQFYLL